MESVREMIDTLKLKYLEKSLIKKTPDELQKMLDKLNSDYNEIRRRMNTDRTVVVYLSSDELDALERLESLSKGDNLVRSVYLQILQNKYLKRSIRG